MMVMLLLLFTLHLCALSYQDAPSSQFSDYLIDQFEHLSRSNLLRESFSDIKKNIRVRSEYPLSTLTYAKNKLEELFSDRILALQKLTLSAERSAKFYTGFEDYKYIPLSDEQCEKYSNIINQSDVHLISNDSREKSGVHVNIESFKCDHRVIRDFEFTGAEIVEKTMIENKEIYPKMGHQFIGTYSGLTRMFPRRYWEVEPSQITIDLYDPKFRPWFVNAETAPKDIVFLMDYSGSVKGPTMHLIKITMMYILSTLSPNDSFFGVYFNSGFSPIFSCDNRTFIPATTSNKKVFFERLGTIEEKDQAHFGPPLNYSLDVLRENLDSNASLFSGSRSGGHKLLMMFTDGVDEWPYEILEEELRTRGDDLIRIFGFSMGYGSGQLPLLNWLACNTHASYSVIDSIMDVRPQSRAFLDYLSTVHGKALEQTTVEQRTVSWTNLYMEAQKLGPTVTISLPILTDPGGIWIEQRLAGVAGIDIALAELTQHLPQGEQMYAFLIDNDGIIIYHPNLVLPAREVHCVRRSACYDSTQVRSRAGGGLRVQYGFSDERVYRLVGLIDSIPTIDLFEIEGNSTAISDLRDKVLDRTCTNEPILDSDREFYCTNLKNSPLTLVVVNQVDRHTLSHYNTVDKIEPIPTDSVNYHLSKRDICDWALDNLNSSTRFEGLLALSECSIDLSLTRALVNAILPWSTSWPRHVLPPYSTCEQTELPSDFPSSGFISSFVHTRSQITAFYPSCAMDSMKPVIRKMDDERGMRDPSDYLRFSLRNDLLVVYQPIMDKYSNRLAVVGSIWRMDMLDKMFKNWTETHTDWNICRKMECLLTSESGYVVASNTGRRPSHLSTFDTQLFTSLKANGLVIRKTFVDAQAQCLAKKTAPWSSPATSTSPIRAIYNIITSLITKTFWIDIYYELSSFVSAQPSMSGGICRFYKITPYERCFLRHTNYKMILNITKQLQLDDMKCSRYAKVYPVPRTHLTLIVSDRVCPGYKSKYEYYPDPVKLEGCDVIHNFDRRQPMFGANITHPREDPPPGCVMESSNSFLSFSFSYTFLFIIILFY